MNRSKALQQLKKLEAYGHEDRLAAEKWDEEWKIIVATLLSAQSRDTVTLPIAEQLFETFPTTKKLGEAKQEAVEKVLKSLNYYKTKAKNSIACGKMLWEQYKGKPPHTIEQLVELPGVGRKTANVFLSEIGEAAIGVDTHVARISKKLGWTTNTDPKKVEEDLKALFPKEAWSRINLVLVRFGQNNRGKKEDGVLKEIINT